jgi:hypothetical protein
MSYTPPLLGVAASSIQLRYYLDTFSSSFAERKEKLGVKIIEKNIGRHQNGNLYFRQFIFGISKTAGFGRYSYRFHWQFPPSIGLYAAAQRGHNLFPIPSISPISRHFHAIFSP